MPIPTRDDPAGMRSRFPRTMPKPSNFWGEEVVHEGVSDPHNPMIDSKGRVWSTSTVSQKLPGWCSDASNKFVAYFPPTSPSARQASYFDPNTGKFELIYTCFGTHHLQFGEDPNAMLYSAAAAPRFRGSNWRIRTKDEKQAVGWPDRVDTNGDGRSRSRGTNRSARRAQEGRRRRRGHLRPEARHARQHRQLRDHRQPGRSVGLGRVHELSAGLSVSTLAESPETHERAAPSERQSRSYFACAASTSIAAG